MRIFNRTLIQPSKKPTIYATVIALLVSSLTVILSAPGAEADQTYNFNEVAMSGSGSTMYVINDGGSIWKSVDTGTTWSALTTAGIRYWASIATSQDGSVVAAADDESGHIFVSRDSGSTWSEKDTGVSVSSWTAVVISNDGNKIKAIASNHVKLYESSDYGATWTENATLPTILNTDFNPDGTRSSAGCNNPCAIPRWADLTMSGSGNKIALLVSAPGSYQSGRQLFISQDGGSTWEETEGCCRDQSYSRQIASSRSDTNWTIMMGNYQSAPGYLRYSTDSQAWVRTQLRVHEASGDDTSVYLTTWKRFAIAADGDQSIFTGAWAGWVSSQPGRNESLFTGAISTELAGVYHNESPGSSYDDVAISDSGAVRAAVKSSTGEIIVSSDGGVTFSRTQIFALPLTPTFGTFTALSDRYTLQVDNYDPAYTWSVSTTSGTASIDETGLITVLNPVGRTTLTVRTNKVGVQEGVATYSAVDIAGNRTASATWSAVPLNQDLDIFNGSILTIVENPFNGEIVVGGQFSGLNGDTSTAYIAAFDGTNWHGFVGPGGGLQPGPGSSYNHGVFSIAFDSQGNIYAGGNFTNAGGVADADYLAKWDGTNWSSVGGRSMNGAVRAITVVADNQVLVGGQFRDAGGVTGADYIAQWNGSQWSKLGDTSINSYVLKIVSSKNGALYISGHFSNAGGDSNADNIAKLSGSDWTAVGTGIQGLSYPVRALVVDDRTSTDVLYAGASNWSGQVSQYLYKFEGSTWVPIELGLNNDVRALVLDPRYGLFLAGWFSSNDNRYARSFGLYVDDKLYGIGDSNNDNSGTQAAHQYIHAILVTSDGTIYVGGQGNRVASVPHTEYLARTASWTPPMILSTPSSQQNVSVDSEAERLRRAEIRQEKIRNSRENVRQSIIRGEAMTSAMMASADYPTLSSSTLADLNAALMATPVELRSDRAAIAALIEKFALVENLMAENPTVISAKTLIARGVMPSNVLKPTLTLKILKGLSTYERQSLALIEGAISQIQEQFAAQQAKLKLLQIR